MPSNQRNAAAGDFENPNPAGPAMIFSRALVDSNLMPLLKAVGGILAARHCAAYLVGGFVRDALLGRGMADIDAAVDADALEAGRSLAAALGGTFVLLDAENKVARVVVKGQPDIDLSSFSGSIEADLARRDFTIDAMALDLHKLVLDEDDTPLTVLDPHRGLDDLDHRLVRVVSENALKDDPIRLLRGVRFAEELGFSIENNTQTLLRQSAGLLRSAPGERLREELVRLLDVSRGGSFLLRLDGLGLLEQLLPELEPARGVTQPPEHHWDVFTHLTRTVTALDFILRQGMWDYPAAGVLEAVPWSEACAEHFEREVAGGCTRRALLKLVAVLHDVAKPQTKAPDETGRIRFLGHPEQGEQVVTAILQRLRFSARETRLAATMVKYHMRPTQMGDPPTRRAIYRYFRDTGDAGVDILYLSLADHLATRGPGLTLEGWKQHCGVVLRILDEHFRRKSEVPPPKLIDGNDLINVFGLKPGPELGRLLEAVREAHAAGDLTSRQDALEYVRRQISNPGSQD